ncbi:hypothetical protein CANCADRAFT_110008 [Tortispora caseinolytica NRRL Y-17796]|uniref:Uncharacterized protein n=1 Tax=Tortispora caseinolytica NRRL Y-17796 TaxID=767744 RepID=A0A1E4TG81_9ASCO|nr:hypothetical protein CANCADRAFT_110008 [Tortispora caseinolytica NRRL Y-17796]
MKPNRSSSSRYLLRKSSSRSHAIVNGGTGNILNVKSPSRSTKKERGSKYGIGKPFMVSYLPGKSSIPGTIRLTMKDEASNPTALSSSPEILQAASILLHMKFIDTMPHSFGSYVHGANHCTCYKSPKSVQQPPAYD